ncbi:vacuolar calcium ion transporter [Podospora aff. communis PSN243]|uniref:Vacuolar calcium ion transporter n=1 Tax=Podospora aff. communis PSN243 TaxID=3040156 RepID=A0AAV9GB90_9PEZI|nr:vacuolar calcium ion transporter [Podospora aff. communis PSN243]
MADPDLLETRRSAHRVFLVREKRDRFNPFRHIPWDYPTADTNDIELGIKRHHRRIFGIKFEWISPRVPFTLSNQIKRTVLTSWINCLLVCVPIGLGLHKLHGGSASAFAVNYVAEIPLWFMCDYALEEIEEYIGPTASDLLDIFTTNTVQIISSLLLLFHTNQVALLQTSLVGGILCNILVLLGLSLLIGGLPNHEQRFNRHAAQGASTLLSIAVTSILIPSAVKLLDQTSDENLVKQSRGVAVVLLFVYAAYIFCSMYTHRHEYAKHPTFPPDMDLSRRPTTSSPDQDAENPPVRTQTTRRNIDPLHLNSDEIRGPQLLFPVALFVFAASIVLLYLCIDATVDSIEALTEQTPLTPMFIGLILLPIPNCDFAPISLAVDNFLEQTMRYTVGRSIQTALLVEPLVVLLAWWTGVGDVTLAFNGFEVVSLFTTVLLLGFLVVDAKAHWVHGILLLAEWVLIGIAAYFVETDSLK